MKTPLIKWTGSKRPIADKITSHFPENIETYWEPFLGGGSIFFHLLKNNFNVKRFNLSDKNETLIEIYNIVKNNPRELITAYKNKWEQFQKDPNYFYTEREEYNKTKDPLIFYFLTRTCYNGTIRYNQKGEFNTSSHFGRAGMNPKMVEDIIMFYSSLMEGKDIQFTPMSFEEAVPEDIRDVVYLDPPYTNTKALYFGNISLDLLLSWINELPCSWFLNINGINSIDNEEDIYIPYSGREILTSGKSSFSRMKGRDVEVGEYFYWKKIVQNF